MRSTSCSPGWRSCSDRSRSRWPTDEPGVQYELDEWPPADRQALTQALIEGEVPHRWEGMTVVVAADAEATVDELLDAIEQGTLVLAGAEGAAGAPGGRALDVVHVGRPAGPRPR